MWHLSRKLEGERLRCLPHDPDGFRIQMDMARDDVVPCVAVPRWETLELLFDKRLAEWRNAEQAVINCAHCNECPADTFGAKGGGVPLCEWCWSQWEKKKGGKNATHARFGRAAAQAWLVLTCIIEVGIGK
jgi:hypothetical protein